MSTYLCFDLGASHTGVAQSIEGQIATPIGTIHETDIEKLQKKILQLIKDLSPDIVVLGKPESGPFLPTIHKISEFISQNYSGKVELFSEDLSSKQANRQMAESGRSISKRHADEHQYAAAIVLQEYLSLIN